MALIKCPECGKDISDKAHSCIHCGYPLEQNNGINSVNTKTVPDDTQRCPSVISSIDVPNISNDELVAQALEYKEKKEFEKAFAFFWAAAEKGSPEAQKWVGIFYRDGAVVERDYTVAMRWLQEAAEQGSISAMNAIGIMYENGNGVKRDYSIALEWYKKGAAAKDKNSLYNLGELYEKGKGVQQDYKTAAEYYIQASDLGQSDASGSLGMLYDSGKGVQQSYEKAVYYYTLAIAQGSKSGAYRNNLANRYTHGQGVEKDYNIAAELYQKAIQYGCPEAKKNYEILKARVNQERSKEIAKKTALVALGMWVCIIAGIVLFFSSIMKEQYGEGFVLLALFAGLGMGVYYFGPKDVRDNYEEIKKRGEYARLHQGCKCPNCGMNAGHRIDDFSKKASIGFWGIASSKLGKTYECANCNYMW